MKKLFIKTGLLLTLFAIMILSSCKKQIENNLTPKNNIESSLKSKLNVTAENGIIVFKNFGNYNSTIKKLSHFTNNERSNWANSLSGFISYDSACDEALNALDNASNMNQLNNVMEKYQDFLAVSQSNGESYYEFIVNPNIFTSVANKNGLFIVGNYAYRMLGEYVLRVDREKINDLCAVHYSDIKNNNIPSDIKVHTYTTPLSIENENTYKQAALNVLPPDNGGSGTIDSYTSPAHDTIVQNENHSTMRIVKLHILMMTKALPDQTGGPSYATSYTTYPEAWGMKLNLFRKWVIYKTQVNIEGTISGTDFSVETPWGTYQYDIPLCTSSSDTKDFQLLNYGFENNIWNSNPGPEMYLISAHLKAWTRGTTDACYAEINYDQSQQSGGSGGGGGGGGILPIAK